MNANDVRAARAWTLKPYLQGQLENMDPRELEGLVSAFQSALSALATLKHTERREGHRELLEARLWRVRELITPALRAAPPPYGRVLGTPPTGAGLAEREIPLAEGEKKSGQLDQVTS